MKKEKLIILVDFRRENQNMSLKEMEYSTFFGHKRNIPLRGTKYVSMWLGRSNCVWIGLFELLVLIKLNKKIVKPQKEGSLLWH